MGNKAYVRELCAGYSEWWSLDQLADDLDQRDQRIAELEELARLLELEPKSVAVKQRIAKLKREQTDVSATD